MFSTLPVVLQAKILPDSFGDLGQGRLRNRLLRVATVDSGPAYLKSGTGDAALDILGETARLRWIGDRLPVPRVIYQGSEANTAYLLITEIQGTPSHEAAMDVGPEKVIEVLAAALRQIHAIPIQNCPFNSVLEDELAESSRRVQEGLLDEDAFAKATGGNPSKVLADLVAHRSLVRDLVFTHGDFALPNILLKDLALAGVIDWGIAGVADRHRDFMCVEKSISRNCGPEWVGAFYETYGYINVDPERIRFYWLLDQFCAHYNPVV